MDRSERFKETTRTSMMVPVEYTESASLPHGGLLGHVSMDGALMYSTRAIAVGTDVNLTVFYANEYKFDEISLTARISWGHDHTEINWTGFKYGLEFTRMVSWENHEKLKRVLLGDLPMDGKS